VKKRTLLIEVLVEELPPRFQRAFLAQAADLLGGVLDEHRIAHDEVSAYASPRRLVTRASAVPETTPREVREVLGPAERIGMHGGGLTPAGEGFVRKQGAQPQDVVVVETPRGRYLAVRRAEGGETVARLIPDVVAAFLSRLAFGKTMVWDADRTPFPRPVRGLVVLFGDDAVRVRWAGIRSGDTTVGIRTLPERRIRIRGKSGGKTAADRYLSLLENEGVIVDQERRTALLQKALDSFASRRNLSCDRDPVLLAEIAGIVEYPSCVPCEFPREYLQLPPEVVLTCMKTKQKFVPVFDGTAALSNVFIGVRNGPSEHLDTVRAGYQKVLNARLSDAKFFYETDLKTPLVDRFHLLDGIVYHVRLGSVRAKVDRIEVLARILNGVCGFGVDPDRISRAVKLLRSDATTQMVFEYPELQGVMGRIYALAQGVDEELAWACEDQLHPESFEGTTPQRPLGALCALAAKLSDVLDAAVTANLPTGASDPYGLKRSTDGMLRLLMDRGIDLPFRYVAEQFSAAFEGRYDVALQPALEFVRQRYENVLAGQGFRTDEIRAVLASFVGDVHSRKRALDAVRDARTTPEFPALAELHKRVINILRQADKKFGRVEGDIDPGLLSAGESLFVSRARATAMEVDAAARAGDFTRVISALVGFKPEVDGFFNEVLVFDDNRDVAFNRVRIVRALAALFAPLGRLEHLQQ